MALLMAMVVLTAGVATLLFNALDPIAHKQNQSRKTAEALAEAKGVLVGWAVSNSDIPGALPYPDRNGEDSPIYDGMGDCPPSTTLPSNSHFLGRLPWKGQHGPSCLGEPVGMMELRDGAGEPLWYAVSQKLLRTGSGGSAWVDPAVDWSDIDNQVPPWITVRDQSGTVISDRVAAVVIAPGAALPGQDRSGAAPDAANYLDSVDIGDVTYNNAANDPDLIEFIIYPDTQADPQSSENFNDRLVYITAHELMPLLERRVLRELEDALNAYRNSYGDYPWLSPFSDPESSPFDGEVGHREGHLPIHLPGETFAATFTIDWNIQGAELSPAGTPDTIPDQALQQGVQPAAGTCSWSDAVSVDCTGTATVKDLPLPSGGTVTRTYTFDVQYDGVFTVSPPDDASTRTREVKVINEPLPAHDLESIAIEDIESSGNSVRRTLTIDEDTTGSITVSGINYDLDPNIPELPDWFVANGWHRLIYVSYAQAYQPGMGGSCVAGQDCLTLTNALVSPPNDKKVLLVSAGAELPDQNRGTGRLDSYYENTNKDPGDDEFERHSLTPDFNTPDFNDQVRAIDSP